MSSANYMTARDLFLAHHWKRYAAYDRSLHEGFLCGRVAVKDGESFTLHLGGDLEKSKPANAAARQVLISGWSPMSLREPKAAESTPPATEVLSVGDWIGVNQHGEAVLFAPCAQRGTSALQEGEEFAARARAWSVFLTKVRAFFVSREFDEVTTPTLAPSPGTEPFLDPLKVEVESNRSVHTRYLITSPEFHLKKSLSAGMPKVFEIAKCFRNREGGAHHRIEFHMLEWYRAFASLREIADDVESLLKVFRPEITLFRTTMAELFRESLGFKLEPETTREQLATVAARHAVRTTPDDDFDDIFHRLFLEKIEPRLFLNEASGFFTGGGPILISGYPPSMAALARMGDDGFADRFEVYWQGLELCNAFHELNDPSENRRRFEKDNQAKVRSGREPVPLDEDLLRSFDRGIPPAGGIALGLERLFMAIHNISDIDRVRPFLS